MKIKYPTCFTYKDQLCYGAPEKGNFVSKGWEIFPQDQRQSSPEALMDLVEKLRSMLKVFNVDIRPQIKWRSTSDYRKELLQYQAETERLSRHPISTERREEIFNENWEKMVNRQLRRERLFIFVSIAHTNSTPKSFSGKQIADYYDKILDTTLAKFNDIHISFLQVFGSSTMIRKMNTPEHYLFAKEIGNPSLSDRFDYDPMIEFDPERPLYDSCFNSDVLILEEGVFKSDDYYHQYLTIEQWPIKPWDGIFYNLTTLNLLNYAITINIIPKEIQRVIESEDKKLVRLEGDAESEKKRSLKRKIDQKGEMIDMMSDGYALMFDVLFIVEIFSRTREDLLSSVESIKSVINIMGGAKYYTHYLPYAQKELIFNTLLGNTFNTFTYRHIPLNDLHLAQMIPFSGTFVGLLDGAEAIYSGSTGNIMGIKTFRGEPAQPQHTCLLGMSGAGKSVLVCDMLIQTEPYFDYTVIVEEGGSYTDLVLQYGCKPIIVHPDAEICINYFDTDKTPLTNAHITGAVSLVARMIGYSNDEDKQNIRSSQIAYYIQKCYDDAFEQWQIDFPERSEVVLKRACVLEKFHRNQVEGTERIVSFAMFRDLETEDPTQFNKWMNQVSEEEITNYSKDPENQNYIRNLAFAFFEKYEFPVHQQLVEMMHHDKPDEHNPDDVNYMANILQQWTRSGNNGKMFDGFTNVPLDQKICYFELGKIPEACADLKIAAAFLIQNFVRQHIISMPRKKRKRIIFEEVARFMGIRGGESIVKESYAQMRKFGTWVLSIVQQYQPFKVSPVRPIIIGNTSMFILMRQKERRDLEDLAYDIGLPQLAQDQIMSYQKPDEQEVNKHSSFTLYIEDPGKIILGTGKNFTTEKVIQTTIQK